MDPERFRAVRAALGLTQAELARVLGYTGRDCRINVAIFELRTASGRPVPPAIARLMDAYEAGWRPADWPAEKFQK